MIVKADVSDWELGDWPELFEPIIKKIAQEAIETFLTNEELHVRMDANGLTFEAGTCGLSENVTIPIERVIGKILPFIKGFVNMEAELDYEWAVAAGKFQERWGAMSDAEIDDAVKDEMEQP